MRTAHVFRIGLAAFAFLTFVSARASASPPVLAAITIQASATYSDATNAAYDTASNAVVIDVSMVPLGELTTAAANCQNPAIVTSAAGDAVETFTLTNIGNGPDSFVVTGAQLSGGTLDSLGYVDASGTVVPVTVGSTATPLLAPGASLTIRAAIGPGTLAPNSPITFTLTTGDAGGNATAVASAATCTRVSGGTTISAPAGPTIPVSLSLNGASSIQVQPGGTVAVSVAIQNNGAIPAQTVTLTNQLPPGISYVPGTMVINGISVTSGITVSGQDVSVVIPSLPPQVPYTISFQGLLTPDTPKGITLDDTATLTSVNAPAAAVVPATIFVGTANAVYAASSNNLLLPGATVQVLDATGAPVAFQNSGVAPNVKNSNPFLTGSDGTYSFLFPLSTASASYEIDVSAPGYLHRRLSLQLVPSSTTSGVFDATLGSLDGQALAAAGQFTLLPVTQNGVGSTTKSVMRAVQAAASTPGVTINAVNGFFGNIPMFSTQPFGVTVTFNHTVVSGGDVVLVTIHTTGSDNGYQNVNVANLLPPGLNYVPGSAQVNGVATAPVIAGQTLTWGIADPSQDNTITFAVVISPSAPGNTTLNDTVIAGYTLPSANAPSSVSVTQSIQILPGLFSQRVIMTGRVAATSDNCGLMHRHDKGIAGVRLYLEDGEYVVTDGNGRFSFPAASPLMHTLVIDPTTLPAGYSACPATPGLLSTGGLRRLVHGIDDSDTMEDSNFSLRAPHK